uniref:Orf275 n=1 Tax=Synura synuroidea TaxID=47573 RepID=Q9MG93_9STRA|nr:orf275 [Synura synuroidea]AAF36956.1 orf275 [Synura synuroidea]
MYFNLYFFFLNLIFSNKLKHKVVLYIIVQITFLFFNVIAFSLCDSDTTSNSNINSKNFFITLGVATIILIIIVGMSDNNLKPKPNVPPFVQKVLDDIDKDTYFCSHELRADPSTVFNFPYSNLRIRDEIVYKFNRLTSVEIRDYMRKVEKISDYHKDIWEKNGPTMPSTVEDTIKAYLYNKPIAYVNYHLQKLETDSSFLAEDMKFMAGISNVPCPDIIINSTTNFSSSFGEQFHTAYIRYLSNNTLFHDNNEHSIFIDICHLLILLFKILYKFL